MDTKFLCIVKKKFCTFLGVYKYSSFVILKVLKNKLGY
jgi:hypothetical protein